MKLVFLLSMMYQIDREKELLFVSHSMQKEKQESCVSALFEVSDRKSKQARFCLSFYAKRETGDLCLCSI